MKHLMIVGALWAGAPAFAQDANFPGLATGASFQSEIDAYQSSIRTTKIRSMSALVGWSGVSILAGGIGWAVTDDPQWQAFHQMNTFWGGINLAIGIPGLIGALRQEQSGWSYADALKEDRGLTLSYGINSGLNVAWITAGAWLWWAGVDKDNPQLRGFGQAVVLQGAFLLVQDVVMLIITSNRSADIRAAPMVGPTMGMSFSGRF